MTTNTSFAARIAVCNLFGIDPNQVPSDGFGPHGVQVVNDPPQKLPPAAKGQSSLWTDHDRNRRPMMFVPWPDEVWRSRAVDALRADGVWLSPERTAFGVERIRDLVHKVQVEAGEAPGATVPLTDEGWHNLLNRVADEAAERAVQRIRREDALVAARTATFAPNHEPMGLRCGGKHRGPEGPNEDLAQCPFCLSPTYSMRPEGQSFGWHKPDCSLPLRHESFCQPGGPGHARPDGVKIRG